MPFAVTLLIFGSDLYLENDQRGRIQTNSVADPGSGIRCLFDPGSRIRDGEKISIRIRMNIPDHISESLETIFCVKILKFFDADPGSGNFFDAGSGTRDKHPGSATLLTKVFRCPTLPE
jgi:hypothetical protein